MSSAQIRIFSAIAVGLTIVGGAFFMAQKNKDAAEQQLQTDESSELSVARKHIPVEDSDNDRVPDWQDYLIEAEPLYIDENSSEEFIPKDTVSGEFAYRWVDNVVALQSLGLLEQTEDVLIDSAIAELEEMTREKTYTKSDLNVIATTDKEALRAYGNIVAGNIYYEQVDEEDEFTLFSKYLEDENPKHLEKMAIHQSVYEAIIENLLEQEVPESYVFEHLAILNSFSALRENVVAMQQINTDPLYTTMRFRGLYNDVVGMTNNVIRLHDGLYLDDKIEFKENDSLPVLVGLFKGEV